MKNAMSFKQIEQMRKQGLLESQRKAKAQGIETLNGLLSRQSTN